MQGDFCRSWILANFPVRHSVHKQLESHGFHDFSALFCSVPHPASFWEPSNTLLPVLFPFLPLPLPNPIKADCPIFHLGTKCLLNNLSVLSSRISITTKVQLSNQLFEEICVFKIILEPYGKGECEKIIIFDIEIQSEER